MTVTCGIPTKNRYDKLVLTLLSIAFQTRKPDHIIIIDDTDNPTDLRTIPAYQNIFELLNARGITFQLEYGVKRGQHISHQRIQEMAATDWIWRVDDDEIPEPDVLERLIGTATWEGTKVGAVGGLVLMPNPAPVPDRNVTNSILDPNFNVQWFTHPTQRTIEADHLHSTFLYRRGVEKFNPFLSPAAHREETLFTYGLKRQGYRILIDTSVKTWHFRDSLGGIRSHTNPQYWEDDERLFQAQLAEWGVTGDQTKYIVLDAGRGDHVLVKTLLPRLKEKYPRLVAATCYKDIFNGEVEQISIAEAHQRLGNLDRFNVYRWCGDNQWTGELVNAYEKMWDL